MSGTAIAAQLGFALVVLGVWIASVIGLLTLRRWGAWLYLAGAVLGIAYYITSGIEIMHPIELVADSIMGLLPGFILAMAFFSGAIPPKSPSKAEGELTPPPLP